MEVARTDFDLAIVGGGPAGTSAAITAARNGASVVLFDGSDFPRQKVCGEFVSAESLELLRDLLREHESAEELFRQAPGLSQVRIFIWERTLQAPIEPSALSIPRFSLDLLLWESAQSAGVQVHSKCEVLSVEEQGPITLTTARGKVRARSMILCAGRWSRFRDATTLPAGPKWIGVKAHFRERNPAPSMDLHFFRHGYCGVQPVGPDAINVCAMVRSDCATSLEDVFRLSPELETRSKHWERITPTVGTAPILYRTPCATRDRLLLAGDAAGFIDPFAGDGISLALRTGRAAAECLQPFLRGEVSLQAACEKYGAMYQRQYAPLITASTRIRGLLSLPQLARPVVLQALRIPGVLPYMIRKTRVR